MIGNRTGLRSALHGAIFILTATLLMTGVATAAKKEDPPQTTSEGLNLTTNTKHRLVYVADDVDFGRYTKVMIVDCAVAFAKNWQRDYNRNERDLSRKVKDTDVTRIKESLAAEFKKVFTQTMTDNGLEVVTEPATDVIVLRPAIINLVVSAPDIQSASRSRSYTADAGQMTLYLELYDGVSGAILAKLMDAKSDSRNAPMMMRQTRVNNIAAADRMLKGWATELAGHFGAVTKIEEEPAEEEPEEEGSE